MTLLIAGIVLWSLVHLFPALARPARDDLVASMGRNGYRGAFSLLILGSLALIVIGWRSVPEAYLYVLPPWSRSAAFALVAIAFLLLGAAHYPTRIKRYLRHPMLTGIIAWSAGHLLANGTTRALVLFGGLGLWAIVEILLINRREGHYEKPAAPAAAAELRGVIISAIIFIVVLYLHPWFAGVSPLPR